MCVALAYVNSPQRMRQRYAYGSNIAAVRCGWEDRIMSNGESKIAIFKAALCYGFAIVLRALFLGIWRCDFSRTHCVIASEHNERGNNRVQS